MALAQCLQQLDLQRQMLRVEWHDALQFIEQLRRNPLRLGMRQPMYQPMADGFDLSENLLRFEPVQ
jgi:hypothetical protein